MRFITSVIIVLVPLLGACATTASQKTTPALNSQPEDRAISLEHMDVQFLYLAAQDALEQGQKALAIRFLQALVMKDEQSVVPRQELAALLLSTGGRKEIEQARQMIEAVPDERLAELNPEQLKDFQFVQAEVWIAVNKVEEAHLLLTKILTAHPGDVKARLLQVRLFALKGDYKEAHKYLDVGIKLNGDEKLYQAKVQFYIQQGEDKNADKILALMEKKFSDSESVVLQRARLAETLEQYKKAERVLKRFIDSHADDALQTRQMLANFYVRRDRLKDSLRVYEQLLEMTGGDASVYMSIGKVQYQQGAFDKALAAFSKAENNFSSEYDSGGISEYQSEAIFYMAASHEAMHQTAEAVANYVKLEPRHSYYYDAQLRLITIALAAKQEADAEKRIMVLRAQFPLKMDVYELLSRLRVMQKKYELLIKETDDALEIGFSNVVLFNRAVALESLKQYPQMDRELELLIKQEPDNADALNFLGYSLAERSVRLDEAEKLIVRALKIRPKDGFYLDSLAWVYYKQKKYSQAIEVQLQALKIVTNDAVMQEHLGDMYWSSGKHDLARSCWQKSIEMGHESPQMLKTKITQGL